MGNTRYLINKKNYDPNYELLYISKSKFENDWHSTAHFHPFTEIFFITDGKGAFHLDDAIVNVNKWDLIVINPNCLHTEKSSLSDSPLEYIVLGVDNLLLNFPESYSLTNNEQQINLYKIMNFSKDKDLILNYFNQLINEIENKEFNYEHACKSILTLFITHIIRSTTSLQFIEESQEKLNLECVKIKNYIDSHYAQNITLDFLSDLSYMNKFHLVHTFTKHIGVSPINYVINKRIQEAKNLLATTSYSIRDIASIVGFGNSSYFSQMFKKVTGISPKSYRVKNSKDKDI
ncbi:AraC family transcriptional regulator [Clostridium tertium]|jgi:YesN/AraC family two-component response regulator|uniref:helix-turn-helix domain-containing protein n=1 Tax=Clostridium TaxID=1485 RepID=UPI001E140C80|nr:MULTISPECIES: AraC family transcriptional regulator [Clostridium]MBS5308143.1 helix-turn-helix transcriptional regulator [Clostridium sp.]MBS5886175.1 helix-turn-helix transcriptional regulator [Clostridium sp.]MBS6503049.1 helix-turn-helix transcriptional regulator [Clostridium sp.]MDB1923219.1 AraC family transcriptional regulator [Clostridium tertium]MDB1926380.1 AraC family transcriptional regulator [Clostridium tertium]